MIWGDVMVWLSFACTTCWWDLFSKLQQAYSSLTAEYTHYISLCWMYQSRELFLFTAWGKDLQQAAIIHQRRIQEKRLWRGASFVHSTNYQSSSCLIYVCVLTFVVTSGAFWWPHLSSLHVEVLLTEGWCGVHRLFLPTCSICSYGKHLVMLPTTKKICSPLRFATSSLTFIVS